MSETNSCTPEKLLEGFFKMSPEDQEKVRAKLALDEGSEKTGPCCDLAAIVTI
jgi:hypothetical protein